jgi:hypothetical protein
MGTKKGQVNLPILRYASKERKRVSFAAENI